jgi:DHA1 family tetracycline resistance protein-like MFS transporter
MPTTPQSERPHTGSLVVIFLTVFVDLLGFGMVMPLLPIYARQFSADPHGWQLGALMAVFSVMQFIATPIWGRLSDRIGRRPVLMIGLAGSVMFNVLFGVATMMGSFWLLFAARVGAGIAGATISTAQAYIADTTTLAERPRGMALIGVAFGMGFTLGPLFGFLAVPAGDQAGPWPGFAAAVLSAIALLLAVFVLPESLRSGSESARQRGPQLRELGRALSVPSIGLLLIAIFVCVFTLASFETTLGMLIKHEQDYASPFAFNWRQTCLTYALVGFLLVLIQGGIVRPLARRIAEGPMAEFGALIEIFGFGLMVQAIRHESVGLLWFALVLIVSGFAFMQPTLNSLLSRRTDPDRQGSVLGVGQSVSALARIAGSFIGIPLLMHDHTLPFFVGAALMAISLVFVAVASRRGKDYATD